jgi:MSHA biogenesis protein MshK
MAERLIALTILLAGASANEPAPAQALADPMRPPAATSVSPQETAGGEAAPSRLQSVLISSSRRIAVIDGRAVKIGERVGDATVVAIAPSGVTLQRGDARETLKLHPGVEKKPVPPRKVNR